MLRRLRTALRKSPLGRWLIGPLASSYGRIWDIAAISSDSARWWMDGMASDEEFDASGRRDAELLRRFLGDGARVLDLGCGIGRVMTHLAPHCAEVVGVDVSNRMLARARRRLRGVPNARLLRVGGRDLRKLPDGYFDFAFAFQVFHHLEREDTLRYLAELQRVLKPGGRVYLQFLNLEVDKLAHDFRAYALESEILQAARRRYFTETEVSIYAELARFDAAYLWTEGDWLYLLAAKPETAPERELISTGEPA